MSLSAEMAQALHDSLLAGGAGMAGGALGHAGAKVLDATQRVLGRVRQRVDGEGTPSVREIDGAIVQCLEAGELTPTDLREAIAELRHTGTTIIGKISAKNSFVGGTFHGTNFS